MAGSSFDRSKIVGQTFFREGRIDRAPRDAAESTIAVAFSSEAPVLRWYGYEILDHGRGAVDLSRLNDGGAFLLNHDQDQHVGVVESASVGRDRKGRAIVRFGKSALAKEAEADVLDGIRQKASVSYQIDELEPDGERDGIPAFRATRWTPFEISLVSVPADNSVGVGRSMKEAKNMSTEEYQSRGARRLAERQRIAAQLQTVPPADLQAFRGHLEALGDEDGDGLSVGAVLRHVDAAEEYRRWRDDSIRAYGAKYARYDGDALAAQALANPDMTFAEFRQSVLEKVDQAQASRLNTGELEADRLDPFHQAPGAYGSGARVSERYGNLQAFKGKDAERRAFACGMFFRSVAGDARAVTWCKEHGVVASRVMTEGVFSAGGAAVPSIVAAEIISNVEQYGTFRRFARNWPMTSASLSVPTNGEGLSIAAVGENTATPASDLSLSQVALNAKEFAGGARASRSLLEDNVVALADFLVSEFGRALAKIEDQCGWIADGTSTYGGMQGIAYRLKNDAAVAGGKVVAANAAHDTFAEIDVTDLVGVMGALPEYARAGAAWHCSATAKDLVFSRLLATAGGNNTQTMTGAPAESFLGYPIRTSPVLPAGAATDYSGEVMLAFGNLARASAFGDRRVLMAEIDSSRYVEFRQTYFQVSERFDIVNHLNGTTATVCGPMAALIGGAS